MTSELKHIFRAHAPRRVKAMVWSAADRNDELISATLHGDEDSARFWLDHEADADALLGYPLECAARKGHRGLALLLLKRGADRDRLSRRTQAQLDQLIAAPR